MILDYPDSALLAVQHDRLNFGVDLGQMTADALRAVCRHGAIRWHRDAATAELDRRGRLS